MTATRVFGLLFSFLVIIVLINCPPSYSQEKNGQEKGGAVFPPAGIDIVEHELTVDVDHGNDGTIDDTLVFSGRMVLERGDPYVNADGYKQIDFVVKTWVATAYSAKFKNDVLFVLSEGVKQKKSKIVSETKDSDYPASFLFDVVFDVRVDNKTVVAKHNGLPLGHGFMVVPPDGVRVNSPVITEFEKVHIMLKVGAKVADVLRFIPRSCTDKSGRTVVILEKMK